MIYLKQLLSCLCWLACDKHQGIPTYEENYWSSEYVAANNPIEELKVQVSHKYTPPHLPLLDDIHLVDAIAKGIKKVDEYITTYAWVPTNTRRHMRLSQGITYNSIVAVKALKGLNFIETYRVICFFLLSIEAIQTLSLFYYQKQGNTIRNSLLTTSKQDVLHLKTPDKGPLDRLAYLYNEVYQGGSLQKPTSYFIPDTLKNISHSLNLTRQYRDMIYSPRPCSQWPEPIYSFYQQHAAFLSGKNKTLPSPQHTLTLPHTPEDIQTLLTIIHHESLSEKIEPQHTLQSTQFYNLYNHYISPIYNRRYYVFYIYMPATLFHTHTHAKTKIVLNIFQYGNILASLGNYLYAPQLPVIINSSPSRLSASYNNIFIGSCIVIYILFGETQNT